MIGIFNAKIKDYGTSVTKAGNPQVFITFEFEFDGAQKTMSWYGSFVGGAKDITLKTLMAAGLAPNNYANLVNFKNGVASGLLDMTKILSLDIQEEPKHDDPSKMVSKINWVNDPAAAPQIKKVDDATNAQFFGSMGFEGDLVRLAGEMGISQNTGMAQNNGMGQQNQNQNFQQNQQQQQQNQQQQNFQQQNANNGQNTQQNTQQQNNGQQGNNFAAPF